MRYFIRLSYDGAAFHGWQRQPHDTSVQEALERAMTMVLHTPIEVTGAGRTDTGVNAAMMIAHFDLEAPITEPSNVAHSLNGILGQPVAVHAIFPVHDTAHARFDATSRTYKYFVHTERSPFLDRFSWRCPPKGLDFNLMNEAAERMTEYRDFTSFSKLHTDVKTNNCIITHARWTRLDDVRWVFTVTADRFLRNMVRAIVGTLADVGTHKISVNDFYRIIERRDRCAAGQSMPPNPLFLWNITYPYPIF